MKQNYIKHAFLGFDLNLNFLDDLSLRSILMFEIKHIKRIKDFKLA